MKTAKISLGNLCSILLSYRERSRPHSMILADVQPPDATESSMSHKVIRVWSSLIALAA
jgi:hypothetical protein